MTMDELHMEHKKLSKLIGRKLKIVYTDDLNENDYKGKTFTVICLSPIPDGRTVVISDGDKINDYLIDVSNKGSDKVKFIGREVKLWE